MGINNKSYKDEDLVYEDVYEDIIVNGIISPDMYTTTYPNVMKHETGLLKCLTKSLYNVYENARYKYDNRDNIFVFPFLRFFDMCSFLHIQYNILTFGGSLNKKFREKKYKNVKAVYYAVESRLLYKGFLTHNMKYPIRAISRIDRLFKSNNTKLIIIGNDWTFIERAIAISGHRLGIPVIVLQHGIYNSETIKIMEFGKYSDRFWCWSDYVKDTYEKTYSPPVNFVKVVGYPHKVRNYSNKGEDRVLFISTPYCLEDSRLFDEYKKLIGLVMDCCSDLGITFVIRLHPSENSEHYLDLFNNRNFSISEQSDLWKDLCQSGLIIGDSSSVLVEAGLVQKRALQVLWNEKIQRIAKDDLYSSTIKVEYDKKSIYDAIKSNYGESSNDNNTRYCIGDSSVFEEQINSEVAKLLENVRKG